MQTTTRTNDAALTAYIAAQSHAHALLARIGDSLHAHRDRCTPEQVHWGHVGSLARMIERLAEIESQLEER